MSEPHLAAAPEALADFAAETRPDLDRDDVRRALLACQTAGWTWARTLMQCAAMLAHLEEPRDLRAAAADPSKIRKHIR